MQSELRREVSSAASTSSKKLSSSRPDGQMAESQETNWTNWTLSTVSTWCTRKPLLRHQHEEGRPPDVGHQTAPKPEATLREARRGHLKSMHLLRLQTKFGRRGVHAVMLNPTEYIHPP